MVSHASSKYSRYEIERKFLLQRLPANLSSEYIEIQDKYLPNSSLRIRIEISPGGKIVGRKLTKKSKDTSNDATTNIITSLYLSKNDLAALGDLQGYSLNKRRYIHEDENNRVVIDVFREHLEGLILAEIEFKDHDACAAFRQSDSDCKEVTDDSKYSGGYLATKGSQR